MKKSLEYSIILFLAGLLVILFRWSENNRYQMYSGVQGKEYLINTQNGDTWLINGDEMLYVVEMYKFSNPTKNPNDPMEIAFKANKEFERKKRMGRNTQ